jgi:hypothetical protein
MVTPTARSRVREEPRRERTNLVAPSASFDDADGRGVRRVRRQEEDDDAFVGAQHAGV